MKTSTIYKIKKITVGELINYYTKEINFLCILFTNLVISTLLYKYIDTVITDKPCSIENITCHLEY